MSSFSLGINPWGCTCHQLLTDSSCHQLSADSSCHQLSADSSCHQSFVDSSCHQSFVDSSCHQSFVDSSCHQSFVDSSCHTRSVPWNTCSQRSIATQRVHNKHLFDNVARMGLHRTHVRAWLWSVSERMFPADIRRKARPLLSEEALCPHSLTNIRSQPLALTHIPTFLSSLRSPSNATRLMPSSFVVASPPLPSQC
jgi:hypothetical protein